MNKDDYLKNICLKIKQIAKNMIRGFTKMSNEVGEKSIEITKDFQTIGQHYHVISKFSFTEKEAIKRAIDWYVEKLRIKCFEQNTKFDCPICRNHQFMGMMSDTKALYEGILEELEKEWT